MTYLVVEFFENLTNDLLFEFWKVGTEGSKNYSPDFFKIKHMISWALIDNFASFLNSLSKFFLIIKEDKIAYTADIGSYRHFWDTDNSIIIFKISLDRSKFLSWVDSKCNTKRRSDRCFVGITQIEMLSTVDHTFCFMDETAYHWCDFFCKILRLFQL